MTHGDLHLPQRRSPRARRIDAARQALLEPDAADLLSQVRAAICETTRSQIVRALSSGALTVSDLARVIDRTKWATSQHLRVLRSSGMVDARRQGRNVFYSLADSPAAQSALKALQVVAAAA